MTYAKSLIDTLLRSVLNSGDQKIINSVSIYNIIQFLLQFQLQGKKKFTRSKKGKFKKKGARGGATAKTTKSTTGSSNLSQFNYHNASTYGSTTTKTSTTTKGRGTAKTGTGTATRKPGFLGAPVAKRSFLNYT